MSLPLESAKVRAVSPLGSVHSMSNRSRVFASLENACAFASAKNTSNETNVAPIPIMVEKALTVRDRLDLDRLHTLARAGPHVRESVQLEDEREDERAVDVHH